MNIRDWLLSRFVPCTEKDRDAARRLIAAGQWHASVLKTLDAEHPALAALAARSREREDEFAYCYTVAFAVIALLGANMYFPPDKRRGATEAIKSALETWRGGSYNRDGQHLMGTLNLAGGSSSEAALGGWVMEQVARAAGEKAGAGEYDKELAEELGKLIMTQAGETVVALFLEDKNK